jgi:hypothetical protein
MIDRLLPHAEDYLIWGGARPHASLCPILVHGFSLLDLMPHDPLEFRKRTNAAAYRNLAMELIFLCRYFGQTHEQTSYSFVELRK